METGTFNTGFDPVDPPKPTQAVLPPTDEGMLTLVQVLVKHMDPGQEPPAVTS
jgi:hypothetical protein